MIAALLALGLAAGACEDSTSLGSYTAECAAYRLVAAACREHPLAAAEQVELAAALRERWPELEEERARRLVAHLCEPDQ